ncbi:MAG TPA: ATP-binding protein [Clostridia bacterium]|nr:ATP-binding protein [Clostridia bacterium]
MKDHQGILKIAENYKENHILVFLEDDFIYGLADKDGTLIFVEGNSHELRKLGYNEGNIHLESNMGTNAISMCIDKEEPVIVWGDEHFLEVLKGWVGFAAPIYCNDKHLESILFTIIPVDKARKGFLNTAILVAINIEQQLQLNKDRRELALISQMNKDTNDNIVQTTSIIAHEVRNALTNISAYIQLLQLDESIDYNRGRKILKEINRVGKLFDDFKLFAGVEELEVSENFVGEILDSVLDMMMARVDLNKINLIFKNYKEEIPIKVDRNAFHNVFINLIENAIQAMEYEGTLNIAVDIDKDTNEALISFKDTGPGISPDEIDKIFDLFHTTKSGGSGIGLYVCHTIVKHHGGRIDIESDIGKGSTFTIRLPISR